jgi:hypothetical protein
MTAFFTTMLIIGISIAVSLLAIIAVHSYRENKTERLLREFSAVAGQFNLIISKKEMVGCRIIGLDEKKNKVLFLAATGNKSDGYLVDLSDVKSVRIKREYGPGKSSSKYTATMHPVVDRIMLLLQYKNGGRRLELVLYNRTKGDEKIESSRAADWQALIAKRLIPEDDVTRYLKFKERQHSN